MNFIESPTTWAVIVSQYLLSGFNKANRPGVGGGRDDRTQGG